VSVAALTQLAVFCESRETRDKQFKIGNSQGGISCPTSPPRGLHRQLPLTDQSTAVPLSQMWQRLDESTRGGLSQRLSLMIGAALEPPVPVLQEREDSHE